MSTLKLKHQLALTIVEARNIKSSNILSAGSDAFAEVWISNRFPSKRTAVIKKTTSPAWNETFVMDVDELEKDILNLRILGWQSMSDCSFLGQVCMSVKQLLANGNGEGWIPLTDRNNKNNNFGEVFLQYQLYSPTNQSNFGAAPTSMMMPPMSGVMSPSSGMMPPLSTSPPGYYMPPMSGQPMPFMPYMQHPYYGGMPMMMMDPATGMPVPVPMPMPGFMPMPMGMQMPTPGAPPQPPGMNSNGDIANVTSPQNGEFYMPLYAHQGPMPYADPYQTADSQHQDQQQSSVPSPTTSSPASPALGTQPAPVERPMSTQYAAQPVPSLLD